MKCPRCDSENVRMITKSPKGNVWEMYGCNKCFYTWRSTETVTVMEKFKLDDEKIETMQMIPPIPPLDQ